MSERPKDSNKRQIVIFTPTYTPYIGGAEIAISQITQRLKQNYSFSLLTPRYRNSLPKKEKIDAVNVYRLGIGLKIDKFLFPFLSPIMAKRLCRSSKNSLFWGIMASYGGIGAMIAKKITPGTKLVLTLQEGDEESHLYRYFWGSQRFYRLFLEPLQRLVYQKADTITAISTWLIERAISKGVAKEKIVYIPNGVDIPKFQKKHPESELKNLKVKHHLPETGCNYLITTSRLAQKNGLEDLIEAMQYIPYNDHLLILGSGELEKKLKNLAEGLGLSNRIHFLGEIHPDQIPQYLQFSNIFIRASHSEGMGNSFLEAMAAGLPVIATPVGGILDFLRNEENGLFCKVKNPRSISQAVQKIERNPQLFKKLVENGQKTIQQNYHWNTVAEKMNQVFKQL